MNLIIVKGRLVRDPEIKQTASGVSACKITVAVDRSYSSGDEKQTDFFDCVFWRQGADFISKYFKKGQEILVHGEMQSRKWNDDNGNTRISWEIQNCHAEFCGSKASNNSGFSSPAVPSIPELPTSSNYDVLADNETLPF